MFSPHKTRTYHDIYSGLLSNSSQPAITTKYIKCERDKIIVGTGCTHVSMHPGLGFGVLPYLTRANIQYFNSGGFILMKLGVGVYQNSFKDLKTQ